MPPFLRWSIVRIELVDIADIQDSVINVDSRWNWFVPEDSLRQINQLLSVCFGAEGNGPDDP
jgi:hypothetical protein